MYFKGYTNKTDVLADFIDVLCFSKDHPEHRWNLEYPTYANIEGTVTLREDIPDRFEEVRSHYRAKILESGRATISTSHWANDKWTEEVHDISVEDGLCIIQLDNDIQPDSLVEVVIGGTHFYQTETTPELLDILEFTVDYENKTIYIKGDGLENKKYVKVKYRLNYYAKSEKWYVSLIYPKYCFNYQPKKLPKNLSFDRMILDFGNFNLQDELAILVLKETGNTSTVLAKVSLSDMETKIKKGISFISAGTKKILIKSKEDMSNIKIYIGQFKNGATNEKKIKIIHYSCHGEVYTEYIHPTAILNCSEDYYNLLSTEKSYTNLSQYIYNPSLTNNDYEPIPNWYKEYISFSDSNNKIDYVLKTYLNTAQRKEDILYTREFPYFDKAEYEHIKLENEKHINDSYFIWQYGKEIDENYYIVPHKDMEPPIFACFFHDLDRMRSKEYLIDNSWNGITYYMTFTDTSCAFMFCEDPKATSKTVHGLGFFGVLKGFKEAEYNDIEGNFGSFGNDLVINNNEMIMLPDFHAELTEYTGEHYNINVKLRSYFGPFMLQTLNESLVNFFNCEMLMDVDKILNIEDIETLPEEYDLLGIPYLIPRDEEGIPLVTIDDPDVQVTCEGYDLRDNTGDRITIEYNEETGWYTYYINYKDRDYMIPYVSKITFENTPVFMYMEDTCILTMSQAEFNGSRMNEIYALDIEYSSSSDLEIELTKEGSDTQLKLTPHITQPKNFVVNADVSVKIIRYPEIDAKLKAQPSSFEVVTWDFSPLNSISVEVV